MQLVVNFENTSQDEQSEEDDAEDAYWLKNYRATQRRNEPTISFDMLLQNLKQAGKID
jgi:hypothetical protein